MIKIGYQGIEGSYSRYAAEDLAKKIGLDLSGVQFIGLVSSCHVVNSLKNKEIEYGVIAIFNTIGGVVSESVELVKCERLIYKSFVNRKINHCLFKKNKSIDNKNIKIIKSHDQALKQCSNSVKSIVPGCEFEQIEDTAIGALRLSDGTYGDDVAVICSRDAGNIHNLELIKENIQDNDNNFTQFHIYKYNEALSARRNSTILWIANILNSNKYIASFADFFVIIITVFVYIIDKKINIGLFPIVKLFAGLAVVLNSLSSGFNKLFKYKKVLGYWKYYIDSEEKKGEDINELQRFHSPRVVKIEIDGDGIRIVGWRCGARENENLFVSDGKVMLSDLNRRSGKVFYKYKNSENPDTYLDNLTGIVSLDWDEDKNCHIAQKMSGIYRGKKDIGSIIFYRIDRHEFDELRMLRDLCY